jgi:hypothetical protein
MGREKRDDLHCMDTNEFDQVCGGTVPVPRYSDKIPPHVEHTRSNLPIYEGGIDDDLNGILAKLMDLLDEILRISAYQNDSGIEITIGVIKDKFEKLKEKGTDIELICSQIIIQTKSLIVTLRMNFQDVEKEKKFSTNLQKALKPLMDLVEFEERKY